MAQALTAARQPRHHSPDRDAQYARSLFVGEVLNADQQQHRSLLLRQCRKGAQQIAMLERRFLPAINSRQPGLGDIRQRVV